MKNTRLMHLFAWMGANEALLIYLLVLVRSVEPVSVVIGFFSTLMEECQDS